MFNLSDPNKRALFIKTCFVFLAGALVSLALIMPLRAVMNAVSRIDFISQRLDDYPRMYASYLQETEEWWDWWMTEDYGKRAQRAAFIYASDQDHKDEEEKLAYIADLLGADQAEIVSEEEFQKINEQYEAAGLSTCSEPLKDGRLIMLSFHDSLKDDRMAYVEDEDYFLSQLQAGLPGYVSVLRDGKLSLYPRDENEEALRGMLSEMLQSGKLNPAALMAEAGSDETKTARKTVRNSKTGGVPAGKYVLYTAAYADNPDYVINIAEASSLTRFGRKRSWSLWYLYCAIMVLLVKCLWGTRLFKPEAEAAKDHFGAARNSISAMFVATLMILGSVGVIQMLSGVNLSQQAATDQAEYLKKILDREAQRGANITGEFDSMYSARVQTAASVLQKNPQLIDVDSLLGLDQTLGGSGLRVFDSEGTLLASDEILHHAVDESLLGATMTGTPLGGASPEEDAPTRYYRAVMTNDDGRTTGWVELCVAQERLDQLLKETRLEEVAGDLHILDTLHVVVVEAAENGRIVAGTWKNWIGTKAAEHGIQPQYLFDGYEGIVNFGGNKCYSVVFTYDGNFVIVGSEEASALVFFGGVLVLSFLLVVVLLLLVFLPMTKELFEYQRNELHKDPEGKAYSQRSDYPRLWEYFGDYMISVFLLSAALYFTTKGDPAGLTYNIVRGTWVRGINAATITTCAMLVSVVFAAQRVVDLLLIYLGKYLNPKGMTICRLIDSGLTYISTIVMIIYALSMFGVETRTLLNGVGVTALIFTLGANSLIGDVLAGLFIIFEGDFTVGDVVMIGDFRGIVTDISMRTTKLMDDNTRDILVVNNSQIEQLINQSREKSAVIIDIPFSRSLGLEEGEAILQEALAKLPGRFPKIIGTPEYWGISELPKKNPYTGKIGDLMARIAFDCLEGDKEMLTYEVYRDLVGLVTKLNEPKTGEETGKPANKEGGMS